jgi:hypothetical protein
VTHVLQQVVRVSCLLAKAELQGYGPCFKKNRLEGGREAGNGTRQARHTIHNLESLMSGLFCHISHNFFMVSWDFCGVKLFFSIFNAAVAAWACPITV